MSEERDPVEQWLEPYDAIARFVVFVEQFEVAVALATSGRLAQVRMALVATDHLAELLVSRHAKRSFESSEQSRWMRRERFGRTERKRSRLLPQDALGRTQAHRASLARRASNPR
jgi:hypothetical protein